MQPTFSSDVMTQLHDSGMTPELVFEDLQRLLDNEKEATQRLDDDDGPDDTEFSTSGYHTYSQVYAHLKKSTILMLFSNNQLK